MTRAKLKGDVTPQEWGQMKAFKAVGLSTMEISKRLGRTPKTIRAHLVRSEPVAARERRTSDKVIARRAKVTRLLKSKRTVNGRVLPKYNASAAAMKAGLRKEHGLQASRSTIAADLAAVAENFVRPKTPFEGTASLKARRFFKRHCANVCVSKIVFSDEHWITTNDHTTRTMWLEKKLNRNQRRQALIPQIRKARYNIPSHMIWAAIGVGFKSRLIFIPRKKDSEGKNKCLTAQRYIKTCLSTICDGQLPEGAIFMQDGARCHTAKASIKYLERKGIKILAHWPAYSPDLNPIEYLWAYLDALIAEKVPTSDAELKQIAIAVWESISQDVIDEYVLSFAGKLTEKVN